MADDDRHRYTGVTLGEVNRNVLALRRQFDRYVESHADEHKDHDRDHETSGKWIITTVISLGGLVIAILLALQPYLRGTGL